MRTVGEMLRAERILRHLSLDQAEAATRIRKKFLEAIERDDYAPLPSLSYAKGFVKNYAEFLGLNSKNIIAFFRRQTTEVPKSSLLPKGMSKELKPTLVRLTPSRFIAILVGVLVAAFLVYFLVQYQTLQQPPMVTVTSPLDGASQTESSIDVFGKTDPDATVTINGVSVIVRTDG